MVNRTRSVPMVFRKIHFGNECLASRLELGLTQLDVQTLTGLSTAAISEYERGNQDNMHVGNFLALCNAYDLDPRDFFDLGVG